MGYCTEDKEFRDTLYDEIFITGGKNEKDITGNTNGGIFAFMRKQRGYSGKT